MTLAMSKTFTVPVRALTGKDIKELAGMISDHSRVSISVTPADRPGELDSYSIVVREETTRTGGGRG